MTHPHPEHTAVYLVEHSGRRISRMWTPKDGWSAEIRENAAVYVTPSRKEDGEPHRWEIRRVELRNGERNDYAICWWDDLAMAKMDVDWLVAFVSKRYRGNFSEWCQERGVTFP